MPRLAVDGELDGQVAFLAHAHECDREWALRGQRFQQPCDATSRSERLSTSPDAVQSRLHEHLENGARG